MIWGDDDLRNTALNYITKPEHGHENETLKRLFTRERSCRRAEAVTSTPAVDRYGRPRAVS
jgi:hypothetical protein